MATVLAAAALLAAVAYGCVAQGGFYPAQQRTLLAVTCAAGVLAALAVSPRCTGRHVAIALPVSLWAIASALAAHDLAGAAPVLGIVGAATAAGLVGRTLDRTSSEHLVTGIIVAGVALALAGWAGVVFRIEPWGLVDQGLWRASSTLTYANATAALLAPLALLAFATSAGNPRKVRWRLATAILIVGVAATLSRAGWVALAAGLVVLVVQTGWHRAAPMLPVVVGAAIATAGVVAIAPDRLPPRPGVAIVALVVGLVVVTRTARNRRTWLAACAVLLCGGVALGAAMSASRLTVSSPDRAHEWRTTSAAVAAHPLSGVGPSHLHLRWRGADGRTFVAHATHNEFLQLAAEQGLPAVVIALATMAAIGVALARRDSPALPVLVAFAVASAFDFVWHVPLVPIVVAAIVGAAIPFGDFYGRPAPTRLGL